MEVQELPDKEFKITLLKILRDFPGRPVVKNPPSSAGDARSIPGQGTKIPHAAGQLSLRAATTEPAHSGVRLPQLERSPRTTTREARVPQGGSHVS